MAVLRILGRTALVAFFIFTLVIVAFGQDPSAQTPTVVVNDQAALNGTITIEQTTVPQQAFLVIQRDLAGTAGSILGRVAVQTGTTENVVVPLAAAVAPGDQLYAALYLDAGLIGVFEAPGADTPFLLNNQLLGQPFLITADSDPQAQATVSPTVTVTGQVTTPVVLTLTTTPTSQFPVSATLTSTSQPTIQSLPQAITQTVTQPITQSVAQPTSPLPTPPSTPTSIPTSTPAPTLSPTVQPTSLQAALVISTTTPTQIPTVQLFVQPQIQPTTAMPARLPVTGANSGANLPTTLLGSVLAFALFVGGNRLRQRLWQRLG